ncbi:MAG: hypothetical protein Q4D79_13890 [Propionibacteriaceae bacterium]|nr:hypothetical protein [Propionibacteriaceae bacterium]
MLIRSLSWRRIAEQELLSAEAKVYYQIYADGVHAYLKDRAPWQVVTEYTVPRPS